MSAFEDEMLSVALEMAGIFGDAGVYLAPGGAEEEEVAIQVVHDGCETFQETDERGVRTRTVERLRVLKAAGLSMVLDGTIELGEVVYVIQELKDMPGMVGVEAVKLEDVERSARGTRR